MNQLPRIGVTMGDPAGVGPELCLRILANASLAKECQTVVYGDLPLLQRVANQCNLTFDDSMVDQIRHVARLDAPSVNPGSVDASTGQASFDYIEAAITDSLNGNIDAVATCPINKEAWDLAKISFPGHTELFADRANSERFCMLMTAPAFSCSLVTTHIGYRDVPAALTTERILEVIQLSNSAMQRIHNRKPKLVVPGLNPHAGEGGLFGDREEERLIMPAIEAAEAEGIDVEGPLPPDTAFLPWRRESTDCFVCMYHDQGLIPFKALNFDTGVNTTLGLPIIRTSVDHGTALDIAWQAKADDSSLIAAVKLAATLAGK